MHAFTDERYFRALGLTILWSLGCATSSPDRSVEPTSVEPPATEQTEEVPEQRFENPGGMWMPDQMTAHAETLRDLGLDYDPEQLTDPTAHPLGAVVSLGGCSASFVSPEGLIITNHHCVTRALQYNATPEQNLLEQGYLAKTRDQERWAGPTARVYVTTEFTDVTDEILEDLEDIDDAEDRYEEIQRRRKELTASCEQGKPDTRCTVASYFEGAQFFQIEQLEIRDVRLVYAPHAGIGVFGGEVDNWRWPRHTGDFSFLRAYVGKDGKPADHAEDNVPYRPPHHLEVSNEDLDRGDLVMVAGYPGRTYRLKTAAEVKEAVEWTYPHRLEMFEDYISVLEEVSENRPDVAIKAASRLRGLNNYLTNYQGMLDGLVKGGLAEDKRQLERDLQAWIQSDPDRQKKYGEVLEKMSEVHAEQAENREQDAAIRELLRASSLLGAASTIVEMAQQRKKPDAERKSAYQKRNWSRQKQSLAAMERSFDPGMERAVFKLFIMRADDLPKAQRPDEVLEAIVGEDPVTEKKVDEALDRMYRRTKLGDEKRRVKLFENATMARLKRSKDPFIQLALELQPVMESREARAERVAGELAVLRPRYVAAVREFTEGPLPPDANSTLRITFGTVRGYKPADKADPYFPFTTLPEMIDKHTGEDPFHAPQDILAAARAERFGPYEDGDIGEVPVNFLADLDITGGNSGSATLDDEGRLVGLVFDGNYESIASDWIFIPEITRSIHVDIRYVLWIMDAVDGADRLLEEMGIEPKVDSGR